VKITQEFTVSAAPETLWTFLEDVPRVVRCVPGVRDVERLEPDRYRVVIAQKVGFISATFEVKTRVEAREAPRFIEFSSTGKTIHGAVGHLRSRDRVDVVAEPGGGSRVRLTSDVALGGMLGAVGEKVMVSQSKVLTQQFAETLRRELDAATREG